MKHIACVLLSFSMMAFSPSSGNGGPVDNMRQTEKHSSSDVGNSNDATNEEMLSSEVEYETGEGTACCTDLETCSKDSCNATKCSAGDVIAMPAVGLYAPLLEPQKPKMSKAAAKLKKKKNGATAATKVLKH